MKGIIISAHGGRWSNDQKTLTVPSTSSVIYYVQDGVTLPNREGYEILAALQQDRIPNTPVAETVNAGQLTYDYSCWYATEFAKHCGIYEVGTTRLLENLDTYTEQRPLLLSEILNKYPDVPVYWDACREVTLREESEVLVNSPGSYLTEPHNVGIEVTDV